MRPHALVSLPELLETTATVEALYHLGAVKDCKSDMVKLQYEVRR